MMRSLLQRFAVMAGGVVLLGTAPASANAQKALVYCPVTVDATGCTTIVNALSSAYPLGVDRGYDGTDGTVDLATVDLFKYSVFVVPSFADDATAQPYAKLRDPEVVEHLKAALIGRIALWSGSPDQGAANRGMKDALIQNLVAYASHAYATAKGPGLVALLDASASIGTRYDWLRTITPLQVTSDPNLLIYNSVRALNPLGTSILTSGLGTIAYTNMATFGFQVPNGAAGISLDAVGQTGTTIGGQVVLATIEAGNSGGALVKTDRDDYAPGDTVTITGSGWEPGETVRMTLHEDPLEHEDRALTATADGEGNIVNGEFAPEEHHLGVRFVLTAIGETSGRRAQTTFTDSRTINNVTLNGGTTVTVSANEGITIVVNVTTASGGGNQNWRGTGWRISSTPPGSTDCFNHPDHDGAGTYSETGTITAPAVPGTYNAYFVAFNNDGCSNQPSTTFVLPSGVLVLGNPTLAAITPNAATFGDPGFTLTVNGTNLTATSVVRFNGSDRPTTFVSSTQLTAELSPSDLLAVGDFPITVRNGAGVISNAVNLTVAPRPIAVTADPKTKVYGDSDPALTYQVTSGSLVGSDDFTGALTRAGGENVGTYAIQQGTLVLNANYALTFVGGNFGISPRPLTVTADAKTKVYGDTDPALTFQLTGTLVGSDQLTGALSRAPGENVGTYAILPGSLAASPMPANYTITFVGANLSITEQPITVTADAKSKVYGDADPPFTYQVTAGALVSGDAFTGDLDRAPGEDVGTYAIGQGTLAAGANYTITFTSANLSITARPITVTADAKSKVYGDVDPTLTYQVTSGSLAFTDTFTGTLARAAGENVGTYAIHQGTLSAGANYTLSFVGADLTVTTRAITVTADAKSKIYGDADPALTYQVTAGSLAFSDALTGTLARVAGENVGTYAIQQGTLALSANYLLTFMGANLEITQRSITVTADAKSKVYGDADPAFTHQLTAGTLVGSDGLTGALTRVAGENVGLYAIQQGTLTAGANYNLSFVGADLTITARPITVTAAPQTKVYGNADPALTYQITSGSLVSGDGFTGELTRVAGENVGTYAIEQGTLTAGSNYTITFENANLSITVRPITVTADAKSKVYGNADPAMTYQVTSGSLAFTDAFTGALARAGGEDVGAYAITQGTLALSANYTLTFVGASLEITPRPITIAADPKTKVYGNPDPTLTHQLTSGTLVDEDHLTGALTRAPGEDVGTYAITQGTLVATANYTLTFVGSTLTITKRPITVTADTKTKVYGDGDPTLTYQLTAGSLVGSDALSGSLTRVAGEDVGTYAIQLGSVTAGGNYELTYVGADLTITQRPITVTANAQGKVYGDADPALTYAVTTGTLAFSDAFSGSLERDAGENVGTYAIRQGTLSAGGNYLLTYVGANLSIAVRPISITADPGTKVYGNTDPALTFQITSGSLAFSDAFAGALTRVAGENVGTYAIEQGSVALNSNYALTFVGNDFTVTPRAIAVKADAKSKVYGEDDPALTYQITSGTLVGSDAFGGALARATGENVGTYAIGQGTLSLNPNYALTYVGDNLTITKRPITITADEKSKVYGNADPAFTHQITSGDLVFGNTFSGTLSRAAGEDVGTYPILVGSVTAGPNYDVTFVGAVLEITRRPISVTADAQTKVYGDADPGLTYQVTTGSLAFSDAFSGALARSAGENVGTYAIGQGTLTAGSNYDLAFVGASLTISKRPVTITADAKTKTYGDSDPALTYQITVGMLAFSDAFTGSLARDAGENVGSYAITQGTVALSANYTLSYGGASLTIAQRSITITADAKTKVYGDADPALTYQLTNGTLVGTDAFAGALTREGGENVGRYAIQQGTVTAGPNYDLSFNPANLAITERSLTVTADDKAKIAGAVNPPLTGGIVGVQFSDPITATYSTAAVTLSLPGTYPIVPALNPVPQLANYDVTVVNGTLTVTPNAAPVLGVITAPLLPTALGTGVNVSAPFTDVDVAASQPYTAIIDWGNGTSSTSAFTTPGTITGSTVYPATGVYTIKVTIQQNNFSTTHFDTDTLEYYVVVYDPNGGFVTGGGWINSPAGAYAPNPSLTGRANFGFVAKYQKGQTKPSGDTEFQFHTGNINFKSKAYDWLVINGTTKAQYKGTGTVNGAGNYGFMLSVVDGDGFGNKKPDAFRIKIWDIASGDVVYDNNMYADELADPTTTLGGGSIQIKSK